VHACAPFCGTGLVVSVFKRVLFFPLFSTSLSLKFFEALFIAHQVFVIIPEKKQWLTRNERRPQQASMHMISFMFDAPATLQMMKYVIVSKKKKMLRGKTIIIHMSKEYSNMTSLISFRKLANLVRFQKCRN
jgi:hypothetical protein